MSHPYWLRNRLPSGYMWDEKQGCTYRLKERLVRTCVGNKIKSVEIGPDIKMKPIHRTMLLMGASQSDKYKVVNDMLSYLINEQKTGNDDLKVTVKDAGKNWIKIYNFIQPGMVTTIVDTPAILDIPDDQRRLRQLAHFLTTASTTTGTEFLNCVSIVTADPLQIHDGVFHRIPKSMIGITRVLVTGNTDMIANIRCRGVHNFYGTFAAGSCRQLMVSMVNPNNAIKWSQMSSIVNQTIDIHHILTSLKTTKQNIIKSFNDDQDTVAFDLIMESGNDVTRLHRMLIELCQMSMGEPELDYPALTNFVYIIEKLHYMISPQS